MTILIADDEELLRTALASAFTRFGHQVFQAEDGVAALTLLSGNPVDVVISDIQMPEMTGLELLAWIRERDPREPITILITGHCEHTREEVIQRGGSDLFMKPFRFRDLSTRVQELVMSRPLQKEKPTRYGGTTGARN